MSRENDFYVRMIADTALMAILLGGVYKAESTGIEGISRETTPTAFDTTTGYLKPTCMVRQRGRLPDGIVQDTIKQVSSTSQVVECWLYCDALAGYTPIDAALNRLYVLFTGYQFSDTFEINYINLLDRLRDKGALRGASMSKIDFQVRSIWQP